MVDRRSLEENFNDFSDGDNIINTGGWDNWGTPTATNFFKALDVSGNIVGHFKCDGSATITPTLTLTRPTRDIPDGESYVFTLTPKAVGASGQAVYRLGDASSYDRIDTRINPSLQFQTRKPDLSWVTVTTLVVDTNYIIEVIMVSSTKHYFRINGVLYDNN
ncbi:MAG: hypothetical protein GWN00_09525, partial [Aliifodinibius sp.]|nr:hypothetical protein [Phycisphaerae bacterium]NIT56448.1 hypothetical protein [Fodinibius sp.]NIV16394.1 hypothetical protein [Fodinibius sp.]NIY25031.1 hypothetical protein [Fodinibius sp.]